MTITERHLTPYIKRDLETKLVLLMGPRQAGKTTLLRQLFTNYDYFNYDDADDRLTLAEKSWNREQPLIIFDELHKMQQMCKQWKHWLLC